MRTLLRYPSRPNTTIKSIPEHHTERERERAHLSPVACVPAPVRKAMHLWE